MTLDKMDIGVMLKAMKVYVAYLVRFCNNAVIPYDHLPVANELRGRLEAVASSVGGKTGSLSGPEICRAAGQDTQALDGHLEASRKETQGVSFWKGNRQVQLANQVQIKLSRILHLINFSVANRYGFDYYGLTALYTPIPCLYETRDLAHLPPHSTNTEPGLPIWCNRSIELPRWSPGCFRVERRCPRGFKIGGKGREEEFSFFLEPLNLGPF